MKQRKYNIIDIIKIENRTCADHEISELIIEDNLIPKESIINIVIQERACIIIRIFDSIIISGIAIIYICNSIAIRQKEIVFNKSKYEIKKAVEKIELVKTLSNKNDGVVINDDLPYSFASKKIDYAIDVYEVLNDTLGEDKNSKLIKNLNSMFIENALDIYINHTEWMYRKLMYRNLKKVDGIIVDDFIHVITDNEKLLLLNWHVLNMLIEWKQFYFFIKKWDILYILRCIQYLNSIFRILKKEG